MAAHFFVFVVVFTLHVAAAKIYDKCELARELVYKYDFKKVKAVTSEIYRISARMLMLYVNFYGSVCSTRIGIIFVLYFWSKE